ncbi:dihydropteroate synthase [Cysteiniphilum halobium]|uniref:dihydropteroate synthase n=1 Tax=Cysteiniphilum halobium TaxID=2219059 RepID=UPI000E65A053|nr:dihydropteroate synthase [Cysteiniphilum halobium]
MREVVLGLGSNVGHKLSNLRQAVDLITKHVGQVQEVSPIYQSKALLPPNAPSTWDIDYYNLAILVQTDLDPEALLNEIKGIETKLGRDPDHAFWSPREIDIDILCCANLIYQSDYLTIPHKELLKRNFALKPLLDVYPCWHHPEYPNDLYQYSKTMPALKIAPFTLSGSQIMAVVNLSSDSFSQDGECVISLDAFAQYIRKLVEEGAEVIDLGAESTKPGVSPLTAKVYWQRLRPYLEIVESLVNARVLPIDLKVSIDTYHAEVVAKALNYTCVKIINDVYGLEAKEIVALIKDKAIDYVFMHQLGIAGSKYLASDSNPISEVIAFAKKKIKMLTDAGMHTEKLIFDVGIGFGKTSYQAQCLLENIAEIKKSLGIKILVGHSRKASVMPYVVNKDNTQKDLATAMISRDLIKKDIDYLRVHNVALTTMAKHI